MEALALGDRLSTGETICLRDQVSSIINMGIQVVANIIWN
jgi:hypothetical protein